MSTPELYPLLFNPIFNYRIWGGKKLKTVLHKSISESSIGESWEISNVPNAATLVAQGPLKGKSLEELIALYGAQFLGEKVVANFGNTFPLLIKFLDAKLPLSIQVHPNDEIAMERHHSFGKNEMWYVLEAEADAELIVGFEKPLSKENYLQKLNENSILDVLHREKVKEGDTFYIPTGRVHAIGAGILLAEIQQTSDVTYRIYDYDRIDTTTGKQRELHNDLAVDVIDFNIPDSYKTSYHTQENKACELVHSPYFKTDLIELNGIMDLSIEPFDSFVIVIGVSGKVSLTYKETVYSLNQGQTLLLPASLNTTQLEGEGKLLLVRM